MPGLGLGLGVWLGRRAGGLAWTPASVAGLTFWLQAAGTLWQDSGRTTAATADAAPVGAADDASASGFNAVQATAGSRPTLQTNEINALPVIRTDGTDDYLLATGSVASGTGLTVFLAGRFVAGVGNSRLLALYQNGQTNDYDNDPSVILYNPSGQVVRLYRNGAFVDTADLGTATAHVLTMRFTGTTAQLWLNGVSAGTAASTGTFGADRTIVGAGYQGGITNFANYDFGDALVYNASLNDTDRGLVESYLMTRYGL